MRSGSSPHHAETGGRLYHQHRVGTIVHWFPNGARYCASKGAIVQITRVMAIEWAKYKIRVKAIAPGFFNTPLNAGLLASEEYMKPILDKIPLGRGGEPEEIVGP